MTSQLISITDKAAKEVKAIQEREDKIGAVLRVSVVGGGCSGLSYALNFELAPEENDRLVEAYGVKLVVDKKSALFLRGTTLDFTDGLSGTGFVFKNPNAQDSCGCGSSFST